MLVQATCPKFGKPFFRGRLMLMAEQSNRHHSTPIYRQHLLRRLIQFPPKYHKIQNRRRVNFHSNLFPTARLLRHQHTVKC
jgi:hypothetical protein